MSLTSGTARTTPVRAVTSAAPEQTGTHQDRPCLASVDHTPPRGCCHSSRHRCDPHGNDHWILLARSRSPKVGLAQHEWWGLHPVWLCHPAVRFRKCLPLHRWCCLRRRLRSYAPSPLAVAEYGTGEPRQRTLLWHRAGDYQLWVHGAIGILPSVSSRLLQPQSRLEGHSCHFSLALGLRSVPGLDLQPDTCGRP